MTVINMTEAFALDRSKLSQIEITAINNTVKNSSDFTKITCIANSVMNVSGTVNVPDSVFMLPISSQEGHVSLFQATVKDGAFTVDITLDKSGVYTYSNNEADMFLPEPMFNTKIITFYVVNA